ncbi:MAG: lipocalin-like domain-containing protein [Verrucomicrobiales bacterium]
MRTKSHYIGALAAMIGLASLLAEDSPRWNVPRSDYRLSFPSDHGSHPDFKIEWWYLTGHLFSGDRRFGFQATFFRLGQKPVPVAEDVFFGDSQIYMAHMGLSDPETGTFHHESRLNRGGWDAGAAIGGLDLSNGNWSLSGDEESMRLEGSIRSDAAFSLALKPRKSHVVFGEGGVSRKGPEGTAASYYITFPRLSAEGDVTLEGETFTVEGEAWMDHEISSSQLDRNQVGWDWVCMQLFDGREVMAYILREKDGTPSQYSQFVWVGTDGERTPLAYDDFEWIPDGQWKSPETGAVYPISPIVATTDPATAEPLRLKIVPVMANQEVVAGPGGVSYWEGACDVEDAKGEKLGRAYLELTGYADDLGEKLR